MFSINFAICFICFAKTDRPLMLKCYYCYYATHLNKY